MESRSELRLVTCLFIDIVGSTQLGQNLGPERMRQMLADAFRDISAIATAEGGTVEKYIGDAVFVLFGAPASHADDAARALRAAEASAMWANAHNVGIRAGVETGEALVDLHAVGERQRMAVGACVNIAARLQQLAAPGEVMAGPTAAAAAKGLADFEALGKRDLKGLGEMPIFRLRTTRTHAPVELPFVGRRPELARLRDAFDRARAGRPALALLIGPPGIGKSRVLDELARSLRDDTVQLTARMRPGGETGVSPFRQLIREGDETSIPASVAHSAGIRSDPRILALAMTDRRHEIFLGWRDYLASLSRDRPLLLRGEDLHWAESELVRLLDRLTSEPGLRLMVVATARPEFPGMPLIHEGDDRLFIELQRLDNEAAGELGRAAGARAEDLARAEGHPLFIVELGRSGGARVAADLPVTVQAAIGARLDELPESDRELLQTAAVIGETFDVRGLALLTEGDPVEIVGALARLAHLRYIEPIDGRFRFHHALLHEVAASRMPASARLRLHARYARDGLRREDVEAAAHHWWEALGPADAAWVWEGAPELASMRASALEAHIAAGLGLGNRLAMDRASEIFERARQLAADPLQRAHVEESFALACSRNAMGNDAAEHRLAAVELYREAGRVPPASLYADMLDLITYNWGYFKRLPAYDEVIRLLDDGIAIARQTDDPANLLRLLVQRGFFLNDAGVLEETAALLARAPDLRPYADALWRMALVHFTVSKDIDRALEACDRAFAAAEEGAHFNRAEALVWRSNAHFHAGDLDAAEVDADELIALSATLGYHTKQHGLGAKGRVRFARGDWPGTRALGDQLRALVRDTPDGAFCLIGASLAAYAAVADVARGGRLPADLSALAERLLPEVTATRAAALLLARSLGGEIDPTDEAEALRAYSPETPIWNREQIWDVIGIHIALSYVAQARWADAGRLLPELDAMTSRGAGFAGALASAIREEIEAAATGSRPAHAELRRLGYVGISELLRYRTADARSAASIER